MGQALPLIAMAASAAMQAAESDRVARKQDEQMTQGLLAQSRKQQAADAKVNEQLQRMEGSSSADERTKRLDQYMTTLKRGKAKADGGNLPSIGSEAFKTDSANAQREAASYAGNTAGLMARMDAPTLQRQAEGFEYGRLATDLGLIGRESAGERYINELRMRQIRRRPEVDLAAGLLSSAGGMKMGGGGGMTMATADTGFNFVPYGGRP